MYNLSEYLKRLSVFLIVNVNYETSETLIRTLGSINKMHFNTQLLF